MACDTAVDFHARLRFPRAAGEPPRRVSTLQESHLFRFSRRSLRLALQSTARTNHINEIYIHHHLKNPNEFDSPSRISIHRSDFPSTKIWLSHIFLGWRYTHACFFSHQMTFQCKPLNC